MKFSDLHTSEYSSACCRTAVRCNDAESYLRVSAEVIRVSVGDVPANVEAILTAAERAQDAGVSLLVLPELALCGYTCADLLFDRLLLDRCREGLIRIASAIPPGGPVLAVGLPLEAAGRLYNCAAVIADGKVAGIVPKTHLPSYNEFYERRWFASPLDGGCPDHVEIDGRAVPFGTDLLFRIGDDLLGVEICEDLWVPAPPSADMTRAGATVIANLSATPETIGKHAYLIDLIRQQSARCRCAYVYASAGSGESSTDLVFSGNAIICEDGTTLAEGKRFSHNGTSATADLDTCRLKADRMRHATFHDRSIAAAIPGYRMIECGAPESAGHTHAGIGTEPLRPVNPHPFVPADDTRRTERCREIIEMQAWGLARRLEKIGCRRLVVGISGGLDSTLALLVAHKTFQTAGYDPKGIIGVTMPGFGTTSRTRTNAHTLMDLLGVTSLEIPIGEAVSLHFRDIAQDPEKHDAAYENSQARERTQILMDLANKENAIVLGTGDLSELALGWCTYNGDHMSMYAVNASIPKTLVGWLVRTFATEALMAGRDKEAAVLLDIVDTPISPELIPANPDGTIQQKTEDLVGPYELHDFFLYHMLRHRFAPLKIHSLACRAFAGVYDPGTITRWLRTFYRRFFSQQFKRSCMPDGPKVGSICLSPRGDWRMPSDATSRMWTAELAELPE